MTDLAALAASYLRQARADFKTFHELRDRTRASVPQCHRLQFLQMACEKLCKAHLMQAGTDPGRLRSSHAYIAGPLVTIYQRHYAAATKSKASTPNHFVAAIRTLSREIELLSPAVDDAGSRPDNCEYPWIAPSDEITTPVDHSFACYEMLLQPPGMSLLKIVEHLLR